MGDIARRKSEPKKLKRRPSLTSMSNSNSKKSQSGTSLSMRRTSVISKSSSKTQLNRLDTTRSEDDTGNSFITEVDEDVPVIPCSACVRDGKQTDASHFCKDCAEDICINCVHQHQKFVAMKDHSIDSLPDRRGKAVMENPLKCHKHDNKDLDMLCADCDQVYCAACIAINHRDCKNTAYLPVVAKGISNSTQFMTTYDDITKTKADLESLKACRKEDMMRLGKERQDAEARVKYIRKTIETYLDNLEKLTLENLQIEYENFKRSIEKDIEILNDIIQKLSALYNQFTNANTMNESHLFIELRSANVIVQEGNATHARVSREAGKEQIQFLPDSKLTEFVQTYPSLGHFASEQRLFTTSLVGQYDVRLGGDASNAQIVSCAVLLDGKVLLTDWDNKRVKLLTNSYKMADSFKLDSAPYGICVINHYEAITSLTNKKALQYVSVDSRCKLLEGKTLKINEFCRDVDFHNETIFVVCCTLKDGGVCRVNLYDQDGQLLRKIETDTAGKCLFKRTQYLALNSIGHALVSDEDVGILNLDEAGNMTSLFTHKSLKYPYGVTITSNDQILVCGFGSHNVLQFGRNGVMLGEILSEDAGMKHPRSIAYDVHSHRIIVACKHSNLIRVYKLY